MENTTTTTRAESKSFSISSEAGNPFEIFPASPKKDHRRAFMGVQFVCHKGKAATFATDGKILAFRTFEIESPEWTSTQFQQDLCKVLVKDWDVKNPLEFEIKDMSITGDFSSKAGAQPFIHNKEDVRYPEIGQVLPEVSEKDASESVMLSKQVLKQLVELMTKEKTDYVNLTFLKRFDSEGNEVKQDHNTNQVIFSTMERGSSAKTQGLIMPCRESGEISKENLNRYDKQREIIRSLPIHSEPKEEKKKTEK